MRTRRSIVSRFGRALRTTGTCLALTAAAWPLSSAASDALPARAERIAAPGKSSVSEDSADALALNPANVGYLPAPELRWTGVGCHDAPGRVACGHAFEVATPLLWGLGTGLRVDYVQTPSTVGFPYNGYDYTWVTWGLGLALSDALAFGASVQRSYSVDSYLDGLTGISAGLTLRPNTHLGLALVANDFNGPSARLLAPKNLPVLDQSYVMAAALRPTGRRELEVGLDVRYLQGSQQFIPRASLQVDIPGVGRARGDVEVAHLPNDERRGVVGTAGLEVALGRVRAGGGVLFGSGLGKPSGIGEYGTLSVAGYSTPGVPRRARAVYVRLESTPGARGHMALLHKLWDIADDKRTEALALVVRAEPASSFAHAEEIADALRVIRSRGKKVLCSLEDNASRALYVCANADRVVINPAGGIRYSGLRTQLIYLKGLLDKLHVKADVLRISDHKSAPEQVTNERASDVARADHEDLLREYEAVYTKNLANGRHMSEERVREITKKGPFMASEAKDAGLVDGLAFDDEIERATSDLVGREVAFEAYDEDTTVSSRFGAPSKVGLLLVDGDMVDGRSQHIPLIDTRLVGSYTIVDNARRLKDDPSVKSVVLRIESGGGSSMAAEVMWREIYLLGQKKPLIVSMGSDAASGGYYIAAPARTIYALPLTTTGSIGVFYGKADVSGLLQSIGVNVETYKTTPRADIESFFRPFTDDERQALDVKIHQLYDTFLDRVSRGRHMTKAQVDAVAQGRVWTGQEAYERHLVDKLGGLREALAEARAAGGLAYDAPILEMPPPETSLVEKALEVVGLPSSKTMLLEGLPIQIRDVARALAPMLVYKGDIALARAETILIGDD